MLQLPHSSSPVYWRADDIRQYDDVANTYIFDAIVRCLLLGYDAQSCSNLKLRRGENQFSWQWSNDSDPCRYRELFLSSKDIAPTN